MGTITIKSDCGQKIRVEKRRLTGQVKLKEAPGDYSGKKMKDGSHILSEKDHMNISLSDFSDGAIISIKAIQEVKHPGKRPRVTWPPNDEPLKTKTLNNSKESLERQLKDWQHTYDLCADEKNTFVEVMDFVGDRVQDMKDRLASLE